MLVSGAGTILDAIVDASLPVAVVIADRACPAIEKASSKGLETEVVLRDTFGPSFDRTAYTKRLTEVLDSASVELVAMAGFGTVLAAPIYERYRGRILNTHPSLLPAFPGWCAVEDALDHGVKFTGCTVHWATVEVDSGPILAQEVVPVLPEDDSTTLHERIKVVERTLYVEVLAQVMAGERVGAR